MKDAAHLVNLIEMPYSGDNRSELSFEQIISITNKPAALLLSSILSFFPIESSEVDNTNNQNKSSIKEKIEDLKKSLEPIPVLEVNSQTVKDSLGNISNYLFNCVGSTISAFYDTSKKVIQARQFPKNASDFHAFINSTIDQIFRGIVHGESFGVIAAKIPYVVVGTYGKSAFDYITGAKPKDTSLPAKSAIKIFSKSKDGFVESLTKTAIVAVSSFAVNKTFDLKNDLPDIISHAIIGYLESKSVIDALSFASKRVMYKTLWEGMDGKVKLQTMNFFDAAQALLLSKHVTNMVLQSVCQLGEGAVVALGDRTGIGEQAAKVAAGTVALGVLMTINNYLHQKKIETHNPELISSIKEDLSSNIANMEKIRLQEESKIKDIVNASIHEYELSTGKDDNIIEKRETSPVSIPDKEEKLWKNVATNSKSSDVSKNR